ncbi:hypothetical protein KAT59_08980 [Candidatus Bipolaricaulota bacterium]|jgi:hypothetical protein|nr:hypothetical protein [Candidatus Bipolaricaulota bacterium]
MGLFDTVWAELACAHCGKIERRGVQFKHAENSLDSYEVGDYVVGVTAGQVALQEVFDCPCGGEEEVEFLGKTVTRSKRQFTKCWVHFDNGFITAVTRERPVEPKRLSWEMVEHLGRTAQKRKWALEGIENVCRARLEIREKGFPKEGGLACLWEHVWGTKDEQELITRILERVAFGLERENKSVIKDD